MLKLQRQEFQCLVLAGLTLPPEKPRGKWSPVSMVVGGERLSTDLTPLPAAVPERFSWKQ